jgi:hypothetical protein
MLFYGMGTVGDECHPACLPPCARCDIARLSCRSRSWSAWKELWSRESSIIINHIIVKGGRTEENAIAKGAGRVESA